jgi:acetoin utilization protein AcuB
MLVTDWMSRNVITINSTDTIMEAINRLMDRNISMLPVLENEKLVGIVTDRDVKHALPSDACLLDFQNIMYHVCRQQVATIMTSPPITVPADVTIEEVAEILLQNKISGVPVTDAHGRIKGIITKADIFGAMIALTGLSHRGLLLGFELEDRPGSIKEVTDILVKYGQKLVSIVGTCEGAAEGYRAVSIRVSDVDRNTLSELEQELQATAKLLYVFDMRHNTRKFYTASET